MCKHVRSPATCSCSTGKTLSRATVVIYVHRRWLAGAAKFVNSTCTDQGAPFTIIINTTPTPRSVWQNMSNAIVQSTSHSKNGLLFAGWNQDQGERDLLVH